MERTVIQIPDVQLHARSFFVAPSSIAGVVSAAVVVGSSVIGGLAAFLSALVVVA